MIFVDTGVWFARYVRDDPNHTRSATWFTANTQPLITTDYCIDETLTLMVARKRPELAIAAGTHFFAYSMARIHFITQPQIERAWILFQQRAAAGWSFTDCTSKIVIDDLAIKSAATLDRHFDQFGVHITI
jgi:predicted nucleic acid-binding protein